MTLHQCSISFFTFSGIKQIYAERDSLMLEDIERLQEETSVREER